MALSSVVLVTGADGFLGSHMVTALTRQGHRVISGIHNRRAESGDEKYLDVCDIDSVKTIFSENNLEYIIHCAAYGVDYAERDRQSALSVNVCGSLNLLEAASTVQLKRFIHIGSCFEYGSSDKPVSESSLTHPTDIYGSSKAAATILMLERAANLNVPLVVLRPFGMWGAGEKAYRLVPQIIKSHTNRTKLNLTSCNIIRDYSYVEDMAAIIAELCFSKKLDNGIIVNVGSGKPVLLKDFVLNIAKTLGCVEVLNFGALESRPTEIKSLFADISRLKSIIGEIQEVKMADGIRRMLDADQ